MKLILEYKTFNKRTINLYLVICHSAKQRVLILLWYNVALIEGYKFSRVFYGSVWNSRNFQWVSTISIGLSTCQPWQLRFFFEIPAGRKTKYQERYEENIEEEQEVVRRKREARSKSVGNIRRTEPKERYRSKSLSYKDISRRKNRVRDYDD